MRSKIGLVLLLLVIGIVVVFAAFNRGKSPTGNGGAFTPGQPLTELKGYIGSEKVSLLKDEEILNILRSKYGINVKADKRGSIELVEADHAGIDFLWPSNDIAVNIYKQKNPNASAETIFNSPIVIYSWDKVTQVLMKQKIVAMQNNTYYVVDTKKLLRLMEAGTKWEAIGLPELHGKVQVFSSNPNKSSSGNLFAALMTGILTDGDSADKTKLQTSLPTIKKFFDMQGFMKENSKDMFDEFVSRGMGNKQLVIGYEAQLIEQNLENPTRMANSAQKIVTLYPRPTVWSAHTLIALNENGKKLAEALKDEKIQEIAWKKHGFRSATGASNDPANVGVPGIPASVDNIIQLPNPGTMRQVMETIAGNAN